MQESKRFFAKPLEEKKTYISDITYSGYVASLSEFTADQQDYAEVFTICPDIAEYDERVRSGWPCHGPVPWPDQEYKSAMEDYISSMGEIGERLLQLTAIGLGMKDINALTNLTRDGWHHMRVLHFPTPTVAGAPAYGIGSHTDHGLLVIASQDDVGGLYIRPPVEGEKRYRN